MSIIPGLIFGILRYLETDDHFIEKCKMYGGAKIYIKSFDLAMYNMIYYEEDVP